jgi:hypothetical protein
MRTLVAIVLALIVSNVAALIVSNVAQSQTKKRTYLVPGMTCLTCHTTDVPTKEKPSVRSCPRALMATVRHSAEEGPDVITMNALSDSASVYAPVRFTHRAHAEMSEMAGGCTMCHHYNPPGRVLGCGECHEVNRLRANLGRPDLKGAYHQQCLNCHRRWSNDTGCRSCHALRSEGVAVRTEEEQRRGRTHPAVTKPTRIVRETAYEEGRLVTFYHNEHVDLFGLECADCHSSESCIRCHQKGKRASTQPVAVRLGHESCERCHNVNERCDRCHGAEPKPGFDHQRRTGWALKQYHERLECRRCHTKKNVFTGLSSLCTTCHKEWTPENFRHAVVGLALDRNHAELTCDACHTDERFAAKPSCEGCHEQFRYPEKSPGKRVKRLTVAKGK